MCIREKTCCKALLLKLWCYPVNFHGHIWKLGLPQNVFSAHQKICFLDWVQFTDHTLWVKMIVFFTNVDQPFWCEKLKLTPISIFDIWSQMLMLLFTFVDLTKKLFTEGHTEVFKVQKSFHQYGWMIWCHQSLWHVKWHFW